MPLTLACGEHLPRARLSSMRGVATAAAAQWRAQHACRVRWTGGAGGSGQPTEVLTRLVTAAGQVSLPTQYNGKKQDPVGALSGALARLQANRPLRELREIAKGVTKQLPEPIQVPPALTWSSSAGLTNRVLQTGTGDSFPGYKAFQNAQNALEKVSAFP